MIELSETGTGPDRNRTGTGPVSNRPALDLQRRFVVLILIAGLAHFLHTFSQAAGQISFEVYYFASRRLQFEMQTNNFNRTLHKSGL